MAISASVGAAEKSNILAIFGGDIGQTRPTSTPKCLIRSRIKPSASGGKQTCVDSRFWPCAACRDRLQWVVLCRSWLQRSLDQWLAVSKEILSLRLFSALKGSISFPCRRHFLDKGKARHSNPHAAMNHHPVTLRDIL